jgi:sec-independent protein translocase protein TatA
VIAVGLHWYDMLALVVLGLIIFGPKRLPEMGSSLGKTIREFQKSMREVTNPEPPSSVSPSAAQPLASTPAPATAIESAAPETTEAEGATPLVEEDAVR